MNKQSMTIFALFFAILVDALGWGIAFPTLAPVVIHNTAHMFHDGLSLGMRNFLYELSLGMYCIFMFLMSPVLGAFSDKYGRKAILVIAMLGNFLGFLICGLSIVWHSFAWLLIGRAVAGATAGSLPIAQAAVMDISEGNKKASRLGFLILGNVVGFAIGPVVGSFFMNGHLFQHIDYQLPFFFSGLMGLVGALLLCFTLKETFVGDRTLKINVMTGFVNLGKAFCMKETLRYCSVLLCFLFAWGIFFSMIPVRLAEHFAWHGASIGYFITYVALIFAFIVMAVIPKVTARVSLKKMVAIALLALLAGSIIFPLLQNADYVWLAILLMTGVPFTYVGIVTLLSHAVSEKEQGRIMGVTGSIFALTWGVGPVLSGILLDHGAWASYGLVIAFFVVAIAVFGLKKKTA